MKVVSDCLILQYMYLCRQFHPSLLSIVSLYRLKCIGELVRALIINMPYLHMHVQPIRTHDTDSVTISFCWKLICYIDSIQECM